MAIGAMSLPRSVPFLEETGEQRALLSACERISTCIFFLHGSGGRHIDVCQVAQNGRRLGCKVATLRCTDGVGRPTNPVIYAITAPMRRFSFTFRMHGLEARRLMWFC
jgi:hypothetical protein